MANRKIRVLGIHGLGDHRDSDWQEDWATAFEWAFPLPENADLEFSFETYDPIFETVDISWQETLGALGKLAFSGITGGRPLTRGILDQASEKMRWTAGYIVAWLEDDAFRKETRQLILSAIAEHEPTIIIAHSMGSLLTYDAFSHPDLMESPAAHVLKRATYVTIGSQIGNRFVRGNLTPGRIEPLPVRHWYHFYNKHDDVFTSPIKLVDVPNFTQLETHFDIEGWADHSAAGYITHQNAIEGAWIPIAENRPGQRYLLAPPKGRKSSTARARKPNRRALLIGINDYPNEGDKLEGCVNDVFLMSSVLQECGFEAEDIRTCLDARADANGILDRMDWLVDGARGGDERVLFYSGHGARVPQYGPEGEPDNYIETLVPWDFNWTPETCISDVQIEEFYTQLPYDLRFAMIFDCCHSGGIHRDGGAKVRGLTPPDDIRHRALRWDIKSQMWVPRDFQPINKNYSAKRTVNQEFFGKDGVTTRIGRAAPLRGMSHSQYDRMKAARGDGPVGPYLPLILEACREEQYSYEYRHGVVSYGAFNYSLASILRRSKRVTFNDLIGQTKAQLEYLGYDQEPQILGPGAVVNANVPWLT